MIYEHWFHIWAAGDWREPLAEHLLAFNQYGYDGRFNVGIVGEPHQRVEALDELHWTRKSDLVIEAKRGCERVTIHRLPEHRLRRLATGARARQASRPVGPRTITSAGDQWARDDAATVGCRFVARDRSNRDGTWRRT
jgi:hypothetical protein